MQAIRRALVLVDLQNDFCPGGALAVSRGDEVVEVANRIQPHFDLVVATRDWHPPEHGSFAANHPGRQVGDLVELGGEEQILWPVHCVQGTLGAELVPGLRTERIEEVFYKGVDPAIDSYSAFHDNGHRRSTGLADFLRRRGVREVWLMGLATDYCVRATALDCLAEGFSTLVIVDGCRAVDLTPGDGARALLEVEEAGARLVESGEAGGEGTDS